ncbi:MAG TPA: restriction endonuclease [Alteromonas sp.]|nr:restriction endonuclease [Alteromonas sp.]|tara:strand:+ start:1407 stop:2882 length:1476 start_codon:yes stop_codon:yes gene_type:complete
MTIPASWKQTELGEILLSIVGGGTPSKSIQSYYEGNIPWMSVKDMNRNILHDTVDHISEEAVKNSSTNVIPSGTPIVATRMSLGKIIVANFDSAINQDLKALFPASGVNREYLIDWYRSISRKIEELGTGTTVKGIRLDVLKSLEFPLPPPEEQKVIADKLDTLLTQVETTKARLERIPEILKNFRQSVLAAAVSGKLTVEWREKFKPEMVDIASISKEQFSTGLTMGNFGKKMDKSPDISGDENGKFVSHIAGWLPIRIGALCECVVPNRDKPKSFSGGYHWLLTPNFDEQSIWIDYKEIESGLSEEEVITYRAKIIKPGNVIMTCVGRVGLSAVLEESSVINQQLHAFKVNSHIKAEYLAYCVRANVEYYESKATSTTVKYLNKTACNSLPIPLPTIEEQDEIIRRVEELFAFADSIEQKTNASLQRVNKLTQSILAKAFRGELTANWRAANPELISGENSAEALLVIIKNERAKLSQTKKGRGKSVEN